MLTTLLNDDTGINITLTGQSCQLFGADRRLETGESLPDNQWPLLPVVRQKDLR